MLVHEYATATAEQVHESALWWLAISRPSTMHTGCGSSAASRLESDEPALGDALQEVEGAEALQ